MSTPNERLAAAAAGGGLPARLVKVAAGDVAAVAAAAGEPDDVTRALAKGVAGLKPAAAVHVRADHLGHLLGKAASPAPVAEAPAPEPVAPPPDAPTPTEVTTDGTAQPEPDVAGGPVRRARRG